MYPQQEVGVEGAIVFAPDATVHLVDSAGGRQGSLPLAEDDRHRHQHCAAQTPDGMGAEIRMFVDARGDLGMRKLHQQGAAATQQENVLAVHPPGYRTF